MVVLVQVGHNMIEKFTKSLGFIGIDASNMNYKSCDKNVYKFEDDQIDKQWRCFLAFYRDGHKQGQIDTWNEISIHAINEINKIN